MENLLIGTVAIAVVDICHSNALVMDGMIETVTNLVSCGRVVLANLAHFVRVVLENLVYFGRAPLGLIFDLVKGVVDVTLEIIPRGVECFGRKAANRRAITRRGSIYDEFDFSWRRK